MSGGSRGGTVTSAVPVAPERPKIKPVTSLPPPTGSTINEVQAYEPHRGNSLQQLFKRTPHLLNAQKKVNKLACAFFILMTQNCCTRIELTKIYIIRARWRRPVDEAAFMICGLG